MVEKVFGGTEL